MKLLLHTCCAPCLSGCMEALGEEKTDLLKPDLYWYNPNIHPYTEYCSRRDCLISFAGEENLELLLEDEYGLRLFLDGLYDNKKGDEKIYINNEDSRRCAYCYRLRLEKTARTASEKGYEAFSTTLLVSPYQKHDLITQIARECALTYGVDFFYHDFRPWYRKGQKRAREGGFYMQKYCGCIFSEEERYCHVQ